MATVSRADWFSFGLDPCSTVTLSPYISATYTLNARILQLDVDTDAPIEYPSLMKAHTDTGDTVATTKHTCGGPCFGRLAPLNECPRCDELHAGAAPIKWNIPSRAQEDAQRREAIRTHDCIKSRCGVVCTAFDW